MRFRLALRVLLVLCLVLVIRSIPVRAQAPLEVNPKDLPRFPAVEPKDALGTFQVRPGFHLELVASEPNVASPIAVCFDENGRMFVLEMRDYSEDRDVTPHLGRVRMLEDVDGDGVYEKATIFADDLAWPTALIWANGGLFVLATPDLLRFEDHDGDGKADKRQLIYTGFQSEAKALNVQGLPNSFQWGPDSKIHLQVPSTGASRIVPKAIAQQASPPRTGDFFFNPRDYSNASVEAGGGQYGMSYDNEGRRYTCNNSDHLRTYLYDSRLTGYMPGLPSPLVSIAADGPAAEVFRISPDEPWRVIRTRWRVSGRVKGIVEGGGRVSGYFTGATGTTIYRGDAYPPEYVGDAFIGDAGGNLVHHKRLRADGVSLIGERPADEKNIEFAASRDTWFRPVNFANAPDGTLYIIDMYREVIEHPHSIPEEIKKLLDLTSGRDRGRIWRIAPDEFKLKPPPKLGAATNEELIKTLGHPNGWHRDTATRLLVERAYLLPRTVFVARPDGGGSRLLNDEEAKAMLAAPFPIMDYIAAQGTPPLGRLHGLRALEGMEKVPPALLRQLATDPYPPVRELCVRLAATMTQPSPELLVAMARLAEDPEPRVRLQLAISLDGIGRIHAGDPSEAPLAMARLAQRDAGDRFISAVILGSRIAQRPNEGRNHLFFESILDAGTPATRELRRRYAKDRGADPRAIGTQKAIVEFADRQKADPSMLPLLASLAEGLAEQGKKLAAQLEPATAERIGASARQALGDATANLETRVAAARLLDPAANPDDAALLHKLLTGKEAPELQRTALDQLKPNPPQDALPLAGELLAGWKGYAPAFRSAVLRFSLERPGRAQLLLQEVKAGRIGAAEISTADAAQLQQSKDAAVAALAKELLPKPSTATREEVIKQFEPALALAGDKAKGKELYTQRCATCHRFKGEGSAFGPDLESVVTGGKEKILTHFIDPNREVAPQFAAYSVEMKDGGTMAGIVASETPTQVILREPLGKETTLAREKIARLQTTGRSPMPEGLEAGLTAADVAGLLEFFTGR